MKRIAFVTACALMFLIGGMGAMADAMYSVAGLDIPGDAGIYGINNFGDVVGQSVSGSDVRAFRLTNGGSYSDLGTLGVSSAAYAINNSGKIVGSSELGDYTIHAFLWEAGKPMQDLTPLGGDSYAHGINNFDQVAGAATVDGWMHAFRWQEGSDMEDIGTLGGDISDAWAINDSGNVAGWSETEDGEGHAFFWKDGSPMRDLSTFGGDYSYANALNNANQVVGDADMSTTGYHAFLWQDNGLGLQNLGTFGGRNSSAMSINNSGTIVGWANTLSNGARAFVWRQGAGMVDLNTLLPSNSGWVLVSASAINDRGQIAGEGVYNGQRKIFLMNPVPEPSSLLALGGGLVAFAGLLRKRRA